jgi:hypothetical protein
VLGAVGPWSVLSIARRDQQQRLATALREARVDPRAAQADTTRRIVTREVYDRITNTGYYLQSHFGEAALAEVVGRTAAQQTWGLAEHFHLAAAPSDSFQATMHGSLPPNARIDLADATLYRVQAPSPTVRVVDRVLLFEVAGLPLRVTLDSLMTGMQTMPMRTRREPHLRALALPARDSAEQVRGELIIFEALLQQTRDSMRVLRLDAVLLLR